MLQPGLKIFHWASIKFQMPQKYLLTKSPDWTFFEHVISHSKVMCNRMSMFIQLSNYFQFGETSSNFWANKIKKVNYPSGLTRGFFRALYI